MIRLDSKIQPNMGAGVSFLDSEKHMILTKRQSALTFYHTAIGVLQDLDRVCKRRPANRWWGRRRQVSCLRFEQMTDRISLRTRNTLLCMLRFLGVLTSAFLPPFHTGFVSNVESKNFQLNSVSSPIHVYQTNGGHS